MPPKGGAIIRERLHRGKSKPECISTLKQLKSRKMVPNAAQTLHNAVSERFQVARTLLRAGDAPRAFRRRPQNVFLLVDRPTETETGKGRIFPLLVNLPPKVNGYPYFLLLHLKERPK